MLLAKEYLMHDVMHASDWPAQGHVPSARALSWLRNALRQYLILIDQAGVFQMTR